MNTGISYNRASVRLVQEITLLIVLERLNFERGIGIAHLEISVSVVQEVAQLTLLVKCKIEGQITR